MRLKNILKIALICNLMLLCFVSYGQTNKRHKDKTNKATTLLQKIIEPKKNQLEKAKISFDKTSYDYGEIEQGGNGEAIFKVTNLGDGNLVLYSVLASCGCTVVEYSKEPISPKDTAEIKVKYNTNIVGEIKRSVTVTCNDEQNPRTVILLTGNVVLKKDNNIKNEQ
jgi:hypothetical protein